MANALDDALADNYMKRDVSEEGVGAVLQQTAFSVGWQVPGLRDDLRARVRSGAKAKASKRVATASASIAAAVESAGDAIENAFEEPPPPQPETLSDYVFGVQAKPEDAPAPSYSDAAYAAVFGAATAARDDNDAGDAVAARPGEAGSRARGRSATRGEGRNRSGSRSKSRSRSRRPGRGAMHRAPYVVKAKGAVVRAGVALDSDKIVRLPAGTAVVVEVAEQLPDKKTRYLLVEPVVGWVSRGAVAKAR